MRDICVDGDRIVADLPAAAPRLDASGMVVMPGGVDIHSHVAGGTVNLARRLLPDEHERDPAPAPALADGEPLARSGTGGTVPSTFTTGYRYAGLGYTTVFDAAVTPLLARGAHADLDDTPIVDAGCFVLMGNDEYLLRLLAAGERAQAREYAAWLLGAAGGYAIKVVNPGGIELWKRGVRDRVALDTPVGSDRVTPRAILETLVEAANGLALPHAAHIHCNDLGVAGNVATTLASMRAVDGRRAHFTHLQFHAYDAAPDGTRRSGARALIEYINTHPLISGDVGQVMFGPATTLTADGPVEYLLHKSSGRRWVNVDVELETGCGIVPYTYKEKSAVSALQWVVGLELFLLSADPWRVVLSTDHPNGGSFLAYPELIRLLMDRTYRDTCLARVNPALLAGSAMADGITREYTLDEIAIVTRAGAGAPARPVAQGTPRGGRRRRHHRVHARPGRVEDVRDAALRAQRRHPRGGGRAVAARAARWPPARAPGLRRRRRAQYRSVLRPALHRFVPQLPDRGSRRRARACRPYVGRPFRAPPCRPG